MSLPSALLRPLLGGLAALALVPAGACAADTTLSGAPKVDYRPESAPAGRVLASGATVVLTSNRDSGGLLRLDGTAFTSIGSAVSPSALRDLGSDRAGRPVLVVSDGGCRARGAKLCARSLRTGAERRIAPIDPSHCDTPAAAMNAGRLALVVVALSGRRGQRCHAGLYIREPGAQRARLRWAVKHWRIGEPYEFLGIDVSVDLGPRVALVRVQQESGSGSGDSTDEKQVLWAVPLHGGRARVVADLVWTSGIIGGSFLRGVQLDGNTVFAALHCDNEFEQHLDAIVRIPLASGVSGAQRLDSEPFADPTAVASTPDGLVIISASGAAVRRPTAELTFGPLSEKMLDCPELGAVGAV